MSSYRVMESGFEELKPCSIKTQGSTFKGVTGHRIACDFDGDGVYVVGGWNPEYIAPNSNSHTDKHYVREVWKFNIATRIWTQLKCDDPPISLASHCLVNLGRTANGGPNRLLVFGGSLSARGVDGNSNETYLYHVGEERWERLITTGMPPARESGHWFGQAMGKRGNYIYVASGRCVYIDGSIDRMELHRLDLETLVWEALSVGNSDAPACRVRHEIVVGEHEKVYILGGSVDFHGEGFDLEKIPYFDVPSRRWNALATTPDSEAGFPKRRSCFGAALVGNYVYVVGGHFRDIWDGDADHSAGVQVLDDVWRLHLPNGQWTKLSIKLPRPLWFHAIDVDREGALYVFGGCVSDEYGGERTTQLWKINLQLPTLKRLAWDRILKSASRDFSGWSPERVCSELCLPHSFVIPKLEW